MLPLNPATVKNVTEQPESLIINAVAGKNGTGKLYEDTGDNPDYATKFATTKFTHAVDGKTETYTIAAREGNADGLVDRRAWKLNVLNTAKPKAVTLNDKALKASDWEYIADSKSLAVNIPETDCSTTTTVKVKY